MPRERTPQPGAGLPPRLPAKMLLDSPATNPALRFPEVASALASIIETSEPRFAIGIFGGWGSGKTTLMEAIESRLVRDSAIPVRFNAWRFEREAELLIPLLDTIRQSLVDWSQTAGRPPARATKARNAARRIGRVVRALVAGASVEVGVAPGAKVKYDAAPAVDALRADAAAERADDEPQSLYFAGFKELSEALDEFGQGDVTRIVVFVDDLDRCLPSNALAVLEAMKLFFDLPGFVFVVGVDEDIVERAVHSRFGDLSTVASAPGGAAPVAAGDARLRVGGEYVKKLFQVPYSLPPMLAEQLDDLLSAMYQEAKLEPMQLDDLRSRVQRYLQHVARNGQINPREVKRFINAYTLQTLVRPDLDRDVVLALQTIAFRSDWEIAYDVILTDAALFKDALASYRDERNNALEAVWPHDSVVPGDFATYASSPEAKPLVDADDLEPYLFSLQSTGRTPTWVLDAYRELGALRRTVPKIRQLARAGKDASSGLAADVGDRAARLESLMESVVLSLADEDTQRRLRDRLQSVVRLASELRTRAPDDARTPDELERLTTELDATVTGLQDEIRVLRRRSALYPSA